MNLRSHSLLKRFRAGLRSLACGSHGCPQAGCCSAQGEASLFCGVGLTVSGCAFAGTGL